MATDRTQFEEFIFREARLADRHGYDEWLSLWADDGIYWVPCNGDDTDPAREVSFIYDDRKRLSLRVDRLKSGLAYAQKPRSLLRRVISNVEVEAREPDEATVQSNFILIELRRHVQTTWAGTTVHRLRREGAGLKIVLKKVMLLNNDEEIPPLGFIL